MPVRKTATQQYGRRHADGTRWARGRTIDGAPTGYWEFFRKDGSRMRSGWSAEGVQVCAWTTCDRDGEVLEVKQRNGTAAPRRPSTRRRTPR